jgi:hypothetical protein
MDRWSLAKAGCLDCFKFLARKTTTWSIYANFCKKLQPSSNFDVIFTQRTTIQIANVDTVFSLKLYH